VSVVPGLARRDLRSGERDPADAQGWRGAGAVMSRSSCYARPSTTAPLRFCCGRTEAFAGCVDASQEVGFRPSTYRCGYAFGPKPAHLPLYGWASKGPARPRDKPKGRCSARRQSARDGPINLEVRSDRRGGGYASPWNAPSRLGERVQGDLHASTPSFPPVDDRRDL
jgi:hypothetical protein